MHYLYHHIASKLLFNLASNTALLLLIGNHWYSSWLVFYSAAILFLQGWDETSEYSMAYKEYRTDCTSSTPKRAELSFMFRQGLSQVKQLIFKTKHMWLVP